MTFTQHTKLKSKGGWLGRSVMADTTKATARLQSHDLYPGSQWCVRKTLSTYFMTLSQWKITHYTHACASEFSCEFHVYVIISLKQRRKTLIQRQILITNILPVHKWYITLQLLKLHTFCKYKLVTGPRQSKLSISLILSLSSLT